MGSPAAAAAAARANSLSRIFSSPSPRVKPLRRNRKTPPFAPLPTASSAAAAADAAASSRASSLSSIFSPSPPAVEPPKAEPDAEAGDLDGLTAAFHEIPATHPSIVPNVHSYNALIRTMCQKSDLSAALDAVLLMEKNGVSPDIVTFNTLLNGFHHSGRNDEAETVWEPIKERNLEPDAKCYNAKLRGLVAEGRIDDAAAVLERLEKDGPKPNIVSYNELIRGYCEAGRFQEAKKVYDDLMKSECTPNKGTYETLVPHLLQAGELDCALRYCYEIFGSKRFCGVKWGVLQDVVDALVDASRVVEATELVELDWKNCYHRRGLRMPPSVETNEEESISEEKV